MKRFVKILFSSELMMILLFVFTVAIGAATFIEEAYDTVTAKLMVYNALWFEIVMLLLVMNFIGSIKRYNLFTLKRAPGFIMHFAFIVMIIGSGITRYTGFEGNMHIREGKSSNVIYSELPYLQILAEDNTMEYTYDIPLRLSSLIDNSFNASIKSEEKGTIEISYNGYIKNAEEVIKENVEGGVDILEVTVIKGAEEGKKLIKDGKEQNIGGVVISFNNNDSKADINMTNKNGEVVFTPSYDVKRTRMPDMVIDTVFKGTTNAIAAQEVYTANGVIFTFSNIYKQAKQVLVSKDTDERSIDALIVNVTYNGETQEVPVFGGSGYSLWFQEVKLEGMKLKMAYGDKQIEIPFSIYLEDFKLDRYSGSMSPSSYSSDVVLIDDRTGLNEDHKIFMNNVLDHDGYRFFQSSYDQDEQGTILSVNHDFFGTWVSYFGYFLLGIGFVLVLISKNTRFRALLRSIEFIRDERKAGVITIALILGLSGLAFSQDVKPNTISQEHAEKFGLLIVQTYEGRFEPLQSQAYSVMHKISRKDKFTTEEKGVMDGMQVYLDMILNPDFWKEQKMIYVREKSVRDILGIEGKHASFKDFYFVEEHDKSHESGEQDKHNHLVYKLQKFSEDAFRKKQSEQSKFDKEVIRVDERVNICMMAYSGSMLNIFPEIGSENNNWISWDENSANVPLSGVVTIINEDLQLENFDYGNIMRSYFMEVYKATSTGDYSRAETILGYLHDIQRNSAAADELPSQKKVELEIGYNDSQIFIKLKNWYGLLGFILLILAFTENLRVKESKVIGYMMKFIILLLGFAFIYNTYGMGLRWYLTGHGPWSNGYEALLTMAWGCLFAGFYFIRNSKITIAATAILAFFMLMTASHSFYDPQMTNLPPVLKSVWLNIHVVVITISYAFLGLGFILGLINLVIYLFKTVKNAKRIDLLITELTHINEISLVIGLVLLTCGTFLGGIWANESWGRYWGWDAKETWSLVMVVTYTMILHFRLVPILQGKLIFNAAAVVGFGSLIMTFIGVNYYLSKGLHSYASGDTPVFPIWAWVVILSILMLIVTAAFKERYLKNKYGEDISLD